VQATLVAMVPPRRKEENQAGEAVQCYLDHDADDGRERVRVQADRAATRLPCRRATTGENETASRSRVLSAPPFVPIKNLQRGVRSPTALLLDSLDVRISDAPPYQIPGWRGFLRNVNREHLDLLLAGVIVLGLMSPSIFHRRRASHKPSFHFFSLNSSRVLAE
jgi:hypothetical protein